MADLLVSYLNKAKNYGTQAAAPLDVSTKNLIKPFEDKGQLLPSRIFGSPITYAKDLGKDIVNIGQGVKGKSNDYKLGRMNDIGMKVGSLAIATYLFMKNPLKLSKTMEFVGFGSFFASMALWPKLFIQLPLKLKTGVDIHRKYVDSENRKKLFFQDPKYVPWSLVPQEELDRIGKKNNIKEDLPNRNDAIKATAQKVAVQGNTLWMMTAGFATPIMSSLICRSVETPIAKAQLRKRLKVSSETLADLMNPVKKEATQLQEYKQTSKTAQKALESIFEKYGEQEMTPEVITKITAELAGDLPASHDGIIKQLTTISKSSEWQLDPKAVAGLMSENEELFGLTGIDADKFQALIKAHSSSEKTYGQITETIVSDIMKRCGEDISIADKELFRKTLSNSLQMQKPTNKALTVNACKKQLKQISDLLASFNADRGIVQKYVNARVAQTSDSFIALQWQKVNKKFFNVLGITDRDLIKAKAGGMDTETIFVRKLEELAQDPQRYRTAMEEMATVIEEYDRTLSTQLMDSVSGRSFESTAKTALEEITNDAALRFRNAGFSDIAETFVGKDIEKGIGTTTVGSLKNTLKQMVDYEMLGARASFYRMFESMDIYRRFNTGTIERQLQALGGQIEGLSASPAEIKEYLWDATVEGLSGGDKGRIKGNELKEAVKSATEKEPKLVQKLSLLSVDNPGKANEVAKQIEEILAAAEQERAEAAKKIKTIMESTDTGKEEAIEQIKKGIIESNKAREKAVRALIGDKFKTNYSKEYIAHIDSLVHDHIRQVLPSDALFNNLTQIKGQHDLVKKLYLLLKDDKGKADWVIKQIDEMTGIEDVAKREQAITELIQKEFAGHPDKEYVKSLLKNAVDYAKTATKESSIAKAIKKLPPVRSLSQELYAMSLGDDKTVGFLISDIDKSMTYSDVLYRDKAVTSLVAEKFGTKKPQEELEEMTRAAVEYVRGKTPSGELTRKMHSIEDKSDVIHKALENIFGRKLKKTKDYPEVFQQLSTLEWKNRTQVNSIVKSIEEILGGRNIGPVNEDIAELIQREFKDYNDKAFIEKLQKNLLDFLSSHPQKGALSATFRDFQDNTLFWANIANAMSTYDASRIAGIMKKIKHTIIQGKITDQTEKLFASPDEYKVIMNILYQQDFDPATKEILKGDAYKHFRRGIRKVREDIIECLGVTRSWRYPGREMIGFVGATKPDLRHRLVAKSLLDAVKEHAQNTFNSTKWLKMFGGAALGLVGVTLIAELFFGKKDPLVKGEKK